MHPAVVTKARVIYMRILRFPLALTLESTDRASGEWVVIDIAFG